MKVKLGLACLIGLLPFNAALAATEFGTPRLGDPSSSSFVAPGRLMEPKNVPDFADDARPSPSANQSQQTAGSALQAGVESTTLPASTRLKLVLEYPVDAKSSQTGDIFEAHVKDDLFVGSSLILPRGSLVRGRISAVVRPKWVSRAAKVGLRLDQIVTPTGEVIPLDAALEFRKGVSNQRGELDPGTNFGTRVGGDLKTVTGMNSQGTTRSALLAANIATLGAPAVATLIGGSAIALFRSGDNVNLAPGQEIEVLLTNGLGLQLN